MSDAKKAKAKLEAQKTANSLKATQQRLNGRDNKHTRDAGTTRRVWKQKD